MGGGLNLALTTHLKALDRLVTKSKVGLSPRESNFRIYEKTLQWATTAWHNAGADQLNSSGRYLGVALTLAVLASTYLSQRSCIAMVSSKIS